MKILWIMGLYYDRSEYIATKLASGCSCNWVDSEQIDCSMKVTVC